MARMPTPGNFSSMSPSERRKWIESQTWSEGGLRSILAEDAEIAAEEDKKIWNRIKKKVTGK